MSVMEKILGAKAGDTIQIKPDHIVITDGPGQAVSEAFAPLTDVKLSNEISAKTTVIFDHDIPAGSFNTAFVQKKLIDFARENNTDFIQSAGIGYELMGDKKVKAGDVYFSCGEHGAMLGAKGALAFMLTDAEMETVMKCGSYEMTVPETVYITLKGHLPEGVSAYDAALKLAAEWSANGAVKGKAVAFFDDTENGLSEAEKKVMCIPCQRVGAVTAWFETELPETAENFFMTTCTSYVAPPEMFLEAAPLEEIGSIPVNACFIGGCAGGRIEDLRAAAAILAGNKIKRELRLTIGFVSNEAYLNAMHEGLIEQFIDCGAQVTNPGCGSCQTTSLGVVGNGEILATTGCYNYIGCSGTDKSKLYIASVENVAKAALTGFLEVKEA